METEANKMTKQPSYRFAGYTESWVEKKLGELIEKGGSGGTPKSTNDDFYGGEIPFLSISDISNSGKYLYKTEKTITQLGLENSSAWLVPKGAISLAMYASVGKLAILGTECATSQAFYNMVIYNEGTRNFIFAILEKANLFKEWKSLISTGTQDNLNAQKVKNFIIPLPSLSEQTTIGSFFQDIDQLISLQQRKLEVLKEQKKTYLKLLFPAKGQTKPALRFAGFEDEWKEVKLGGIGEIQTGNTPPTNEEDNYEKNGFPWVTPTDINSLVIHTTSKQLSEVGKSKARIAKSGSILVTCIASIGKNTLVITDSAFNQQINSLMPSEKYSSYFLLTQSEIWSRYMLSVAGAGTMQIINKSDFSNIKTIVPSLPEQQAIGSFFQDLDKAIAKQEEKVNQLKESKQTFLKKMFI